MKTLSLPEGKMKLSALVDVVSSTDEEITITKNGCPVAVLVSSDEFESWNELKLLGPMPDYTGYIAWPRPSICTSLGGEPFCVN